MSGNVREKQESSEIPIPGGYRFAGWHCGIKSQSDQNDLTLVVSENEATAVGVFTQNVVRGAPVLWNESLTPSTKIRAVAINSGIANACTGERGLADVREMARLTGEACGADTEQVLVMSTGVIGTFLPMEKIATGIAKAAAQTGRSGKHFSAAARGMMTTDTVPKTAFCTFVTEDGRKITLSGMAKGAAMIGPNMATMLAVIVTDAPLAPEQARQCLRDSNEVTFHCISVEGHTSTSDTVLLLANGAAGGDFLRKEDLRRFRGALDEVCMELARAIPADGEGVDHLVIIDIVGAADPLSARKIAKTVAESVLVKTAIAGCDPNWGRIVSAAGYAGVPFDPTQVRLTLNDHVLYRDGTPVEYNEEAVSRSMAEQREVHLELAFAEGESNLRFWTTDLTQQYVHLNADYHT
jgi:glutamate N-acetyltransferase/amino-acid N-acetyltransferase